jgi:hypothetical protein
MQRRHMIRLIGGGAVVAATGALAGCSTTYPAEALAAWASPGDDPDLRRWALGFAILAPSPHNRQPWIADLREPDAIALHVDPDRLLPETDPWFRQVMIGQGTFIEALVIALKQRGVTPVVQLFPAGEFAPRGADTRPVARVSWQPGAPGAPRDPLFAQLRRRCTAKLDYDTTRPVSNDTLGALRAAMVDDSVRCDATVDPARVEALRTLCMDAARAELTTPRTVMESVRLTRIGPTEIARHRDGISINGLLPRAFDAIGLFDRPNPPTEGSAAYGQMMSRFEGHSRTAMGFVWLSTPTALNLARGTTRRAEVDAGRAYMRLQLRATEIGLQMHPMSQALQEFAEMTPHYERLHALLLGQPASEQTVQMFCRVGYCDDPQHAPRRNVKDLIRA